VTRLGALTGSNIDYLSEVELNLVRVWLKKLGSEVCDFAVHYKLSGGFATSY
jgi:hypothetical protein